MVLPLRDENPTRIAPVVTIAIIVAVLAIFAFAQPRGNDAAFLYERAAIPCEIVRNRPLTVLEAPTDVAQARGGPYACGRAPASPPLFANKNVYFAVVVSMFLHGSWAHVLGNVLFLWIFGNNVEDRLGSVLFAVFYLAGGVVSLAAHVLANRDSEVPVIGASGAIAAVMGAYFVWWPRARVLTVVLPIIIPFYIRAWIVLGLWFVLQFFTDPNSGVAYAAHVGGFVFGAAVAFLIGREPRRTRRRGGPRLAPHAPFELGTPEPWWPGGYRDARD